MASERRTCQKPKGCGRKFSRPLGSRRIYCETCSPSRSKPLVAVEVPADAGPGPIELQAVVRLEAAGRVDTIEGQVLLRLAREADSGRATPSQLGTLGEKLIRVADVALAGVAKREPDALDEVTARRMAKAAAAS